MTTDTYRCPLCGQSAQKYRAHDKCLAAVRKITVERAAEINTLTQTPVQYHVTRAPWRRK